MYKQVYCCSERLVCLWGLVTKPNIVDWLLWMSHDVLLAEFSTQLPQQQLCCSQTNSSFQRHCFRQFLIWHLIPGKPCTVQKVSGMGFYNSIRVVEGERKQTSYTGSWFRWWTFGGLTEKIWLQSTGLVSVVYMFQRGQFGWSKHFKLSGRLFLENYRLYSVYNKRDTADIEI